SGSSHRPAANLRGNGVAGHPPARPAPLDRRAGAGFNCSNRFAADRAHLVMPGHLLLAQLEERERGAARLGTTSRGIGPAYVDKVARRGFRMVDLLEPDAFRERLGVAVGRIRRLVDAYYQAGGPGDELAGPIREATDSHRIAEEDLSAALRQGPAVVGGQALVDAGV